MTALFIIAIAIMAACIVVCIAIRPHWWRIAWAISAFISAGFAAPYLFMNVPDDYRYLVFIGLGLLMLSGVAPFAEKKD